MKFHHTARSKSTPDLKPTQRHFLTHARCQGCQGPAKSLEAGAHEKRARELDEVVEKLNEDPTNVELHVELLDKKRKLEGYEHLTPVSPVKTDDRRKI